mmetsp:Transcript_132449/g.229756  ORF Transcript_132449/g.229756 Transcript_132449/m.229756 type:complete len:231 (+) Transcript_132449:912-1604(+)
MGMAHSILARSVYSGTLALHYHTPNLWPTLNSINPPKIHGLCLPPSQRLLICALPPRGTLLYHMSMDWRVRPLKGGGAVPTPTAEVPGPWVGMVGMGGLVWVGVHSWNPRRGLVHTPDRKKRRANSQWGQRVATRMRLVAGRVPSGWKLNGAEGHASGGGLTLHLDDSHKFFEIHCAIVVLVHTLHEAVDHTTNLILRGPRPHGLPQTNELISLYLTVAILVIFLERLPQ